MSDSVGKYPGEGEYTRFLRARGWIRNVPMHHLAGRRYVGPHAVAQQQGDLGLRFLRIESSLRRRRRSK